MQIKQEDTEIDIFVATRIGSFKHVKYHTNPTKNSKKCIENLVDIKTLEKDEGVTCMAWGDTEQTDILLGKKNQQVQVRSTDGTLHRTYTADYGTGHVVGVGRCGRLLTALSGGVVKLWKKEPVLVDTGGKLDTMRVCAEEPLFATGGEENDLKIYRIGEPDPTFVAKNLPHDWLQLRRGVWVTDLSFCPGEGGNMVPVCSRHGYIRLYDARAQRRPVCNVDVEKMAATCISPGKHSRQVIVGFGRGQLHAVDFRFARLDRGFKGAAGAVTSAVLSQGLLYSVSLDRHLRVHSYDTKELLYKQYLTSKLSGLLVQTEGITPLRCAPEVKEEPEDQDELDQLFEVMEEVGDKPKNKKKKLPPLIENAKKMKPSLDGSTIELDNTVETTDEKPEVKEEDQEDAIKKLLRSTEKQKRKMEKKKKEKKAKSVFHNA